MDRSANMRAIRSEGMKPELAVRRIAHKLGYRFRLHRKDLPGKPDLVFPSKRKVIFVHGCFWHCHDCKIAHVPKSNQTYWSSKLQRNRARDAKTTEALSSEGWQSLVIWECEIKDPDGVSRKVQRFLGKQVTASGALKRPTVLG